MRFTFWTYRGAYKRSIDDEMFFDHAWCAHKYWKAFEHTTRIMRRAHRENTLFKMLAVVLPYRNAA